MNKNYLIRLDDACPTMDHGKWNRILKILDKYSILPMIGIIPNNEDPNLLIDQYNNDFWCIAKEWENKGYAIALHGYNHRYISTSSGINPFWNRSEFAGVDYETQCKKIKSGYNILKHNGLNPKYFFAPSHTFDENTLKALVSYSPIRIVCDTIATRPYKKGEIIFIPQIGGKCKEIKIPGIWTFCLHPSSMTNEDFISTENFIESHKDLFIDFNSLDLDNLKQKDIFSNLISRVYFLIRKLKRIHI